MNISTAPKPLVVIAAGGTGGHMFPAQAFADAMRARGWSIALVTDERGARYAAKFPADWRFEVEAASLGSKRPDLMLKALLKLRAGTKAAARKFVETRPRLVAGFGGYPSYPSLSAARALKIPIIIHEQNAVLGRVNRLFAPHATLVACAFDRLDRLSPKAADKKRVVGNPVRAAIAGVRDMPYPPLGGEGAIEILVTGGSQGARLFGEVIPAAIAQLPADLRARIHVAQQAREEQLEHVRRAYAEAGVQASVESFFGDMDLKLARAHLVVARSGASTVTELAIAGRPGILIPLGIAMDDHQTANAQGMVAAGAAEVIREEAFSPATLTPLLVEWLRNPDAMRERAAAAHRLGKPDAADNLAMLAEDAAGTKAHV